MEILDKQKIYRKETLPEKDDFNGGQEVTATTTVLSMVNGMQGSTGLLLPITGLAAGWFTSLWTLALSAFLIYYTAALIITHLGQAKNIKQCILAHFKNDYRYMVGYGIVIWISFIPPFVVIFNMLVSEINPLFGFKSNWTVFGVFVFLVLGTIVSRMLHWNEQLMATGVIGLVLYIIFVVWAIITAPSGPNTVPSEGSPFGIIATLVTCLSIHDFLAQNIIKNPRKQQYQSVTRWTFIIGSSIYLLCLMGSYAIVNRKPTISQPQVITDYFPSGQWQATIIQIAFSVVLVTMTPNYIIVSMIRFFQIFKINLSSKIAPHEIIYIIIVFLFSAIIYIMGIQLQTLFIINGAIVGYTYVILIPVWLHFKCVWLDRSSGTVEGQEEWNQHVKPNVCECHSHYSSKWTLYLETAMLVLLVLGGLGLGYFSLLGLFGSNSSITTSNR